MTKTFSLAIIYCTKALGHQPVIWFFCPSNLNTYQLTVKLQLRIIFIIYIHQPINLLVLWNTKTFKCQSQFPWTQDDIIKLLVLSEQQCKHLHGSRWSFHIFRRKRVSYATLWTPICVKRKERVLSPFIYPFFPPDIPLVGLYGSGYVLCIWWDGELGFPTFSKWCPQINAYYFCRHFQVLCTES